MNPVGFRTSLDKEPKEVNCLPAKKETSGSNLIAHHESQLLDAQNKENQTKVEKKTVSPYHRRKFRSLTSDNMQS